MAKRTVPESFLSGTERIEVMPYFVYEISIYKLCENRAELLDSRIKVFKDKLNIKKWAKKKKFKDFIIMEYITWLGAPEEYIINNNLTPYPI